VPGRVSVPAILVLVLDLSGAGAQQELMATTSCRDEHDAAFRQTMNFERQAEVVAGWFVL